MQLGKIFSLLFVLTTFSAFKMFEATEIHVTDDMGKAVADAQVSVTFRCKMLNPVDSASRIKVRSLNAITDNNGFATFPAQTVAAPSLAFGCDKAINVDKNGFLLQPEIWLGQAMKKQPALINKPDFNQSSYSWISPALSLAANERTVKIRITNIARYAAPGLKDTLKNAAKNQDAVTALAIAAAIGSGLEDLIPEISEKLNSKWPEQRAWAAKALTAIQGPATGDFLSEAVAKEFASDHDTRDPWNINFDALRGLLVQRKDGCDPQISGLVSDAVRLLGPPEVKFIPGQVTSLSHRPVNVRRRSIYMLYIIRESGYFARCNMPEAAQAVKSKTNDTDKYVRGYAVKLAKEL